jgi:hypothetical protein
MLFAKYTLREMKCAGLFRLRVGIYSIQAFYFVVQLHIELRLFTRRNSIYRCSPTYTTYTNNHTSENHSLSKPRDWSK